MRKRDNDDLPTADHSDEIKTKFHDQGLWSRPGFLVRRLNQIHYSMFFEECKNENITPVQHGVLSVLLNEQYLDQSSIGLKVGLDRTTSADVIKRLADKGLVSRRVNPDDRRSRQSFITEEGIRVMKQLRKGMIRSQERLLEPLNNEEREIFVRLLSKLVEENNQYGRAALKDM
ncbi:MarR family transcriptional regulator [Advenella incenata]|uniref:MarR family transcriptional regulator n=1 Tax=Advenella incenata TaxID=267800 RepID=A0A4Q7VQH8_9BURK|nr:MarR family transcriptional regulator [Advenella incenata]RZT98448.1 MarR family transcriptional regulator [Advenella incenata]